MKSQAGKETMVKLIAEIWEEKGKKGLMKKERAGWCLEERTFARLQTILKSSN